MQILLGEKESLFCARKALLSFLHVNVISICCDLINCICYYSENINSFKYSWIRTQSAVEQSVLSPVHETQRSSLCHTF
jgi:hypothetical protein